MSPVSAVVFYGSGLVGVAPPALVRRLLPTLLAGPAVASTTALMRGGRDPGQPGSRGIAVRRGGVGRAASPLYLVPGLGGDTCVRFSAAR